MGLKWFSLTLKFVWKRCPPPLHWMWTVPVSHPSCCQCWEFCRLCSSTGTRWTEFPSLDYLELDMAPKVPPGPESLNSKGTQRSPAPRQLFLSCYSREDQSLTDKNQTKTEETRLCLIIQEEDGWKTKDVWQTDESHFVRSQDKNIFLCSAKVFCFN